MTSCSEFVYCLRSNDCWQQAQRKNRIDDVRSFGGTAQALARNPLGIIALFIVLVYGFACLFAGFARAFTPAEKTPIVYFLVVFPVLVLGVFTWLVSKHSGKLFAPSDFRDEENYVKMQLSAVASLAVASTKDQSSSSESNIQKIVEAVQANELRYGRRRIIGL